MTISSEVRKLLFKLLNNYDNVRSRNEALYSEKMQCLHVVNNFVGQVCKEPDKLKILENINKIKILERKQLLTENQYIEEICGVTGYSVSTLKKIQNEGKQNNGEFSTPGKKRPHQATVSNLDTFDVQAIRNKINEYYVVRKQAPTLRTLLADLKESINFTGCKETLRQILLANGFEFKQNKSERSVLIERYDIAAWRHRFLETIALKRAEGKPIIYLDETYVHQHYKPKKSWQGPSTKGLIENISQGKRYIIVHAGSENGFVPNAMLVFSTKSTAADYHHDMNAANFNKWLREKLVPNLHEPSVVVLDNASYHTVQMNKPPNRQSRKADLQNWLIGKTIPFGERFTKEQLLCLVGQHKEEPIYEADDILKTHGHEVLRLPPYHCFLNPIELIWSIAKRKVASNNIAQSAQELERTIKNCFESVTPDDWKKMTDHVLHIENQYMQRENITAHMKRFVISVGDEESCSSSDQCTGVGSEAEYLLSDFSNSSNYSNNLEAEYLESDFDYNE